MKELSIEEKAKRYDEAIEIAKKINNEQHAQPFNVMTMVFHELREESEDERIRKALIDGFTVMKESKNCGKTFSNHNIPVVDILAWLEKQAEQKPAWSEEDDAKLKSILFHIEDVENKDVISWLKSLKDRVQPQSRKEWSEEDEQYFLVCKNALAKYQTTDKWDAYIISHWLENKLKSLRPQSLWKPSKEQMLAINTAINVLGKGTLNGKQLIELQEALKKLREE